MLWHKYLVLHIGYSMGRFSIVFGIAVALAVPMGLNLKIHAYILPLWQLLSPIPSPPDCFLILLPVIRPVMPSRFNPAKKGNTALPWFSLVMTGIWGLQGH
jgi:hypothetical protein